MALDPKGQAALALHRFGFGPRPGSIAAIAADPRGAMLAELDRPGVGQINNSELMAAADASRAIFAFNAERSAKDRLERKRREAEKLRAESGMEQMPAGSAEKEAPTPAKPDATPPLPQRIFLAEAQARLDAAIHAEIGLVERLVWFWSNHFCILADKVQGRAGGYEREAIRPHVLGHFVDMLLAVESDPAMLVYLDNAQSIGPNSVAGINRERGLNENLAREILELHTLGVRTVYSQDDVTNFAKILTGWTLLQQPSDPVHGGEFVFNKLMHEPDPQTVIGKTYPDTGAEQGRAVLRDLARHPTTAKHVAQKLARHFISDQPPPALVERLARRFLDSDGYLKEMAKVLVTAPEAWNGEQAKLKRPGEWVVAVLRCTGAPVEIGRILQAENLLAEPLWRPPAPKGFSDDNAAWIDGLAQRLDIANQFAQRFANRIDVADVLESSLGPLASPETRGAIARAESRTQALALLLMAPEFQRR